MLPSSGGAEHAFTADTCGLQLHDRAALQPALNMACSSSKPRRLWPVRTYSVHTATELVTVTLTKLSFCAFQFVKVAVPGSHWPMFPGLLGSWAPGLGYSGLSEAGTVTFTN